MANNLYKISSGTRRTLNIIKQMKNTIKFYYVKDELLFSKSSFSHDVKGLNKVNLNTFETRVRLLRFMNAPASEIMMNIKTIMEQPVKTFIDIGVFFENFMTVPIYLNTEPLISQYYELDINELKSQNIIIADYDLESVVKQITSNLDLSDISKDICQNIHKKPLMEIYQFIARHYISRRYNKNPNLIIHKPIPIIYYDNLPEYMNLFEKEYKFTFEQAVNNLHILNTSLETILQFRIEGNGYIGNTPVDTLVKYDSVLNSFYLATLQRWRTLLKRKGIINFTPSKSFYHLLNIDDYEAFYNKIDSLLEFYPTITKDYEAIILELVTYLPSYKALLEYLSRYEGKVTDIPKSDFRGILLNSFTTNSFKWVDEPFGRMNVLISYFLQIDVVQVYEAFQKRNVIYLTDENTLLLLFYLLEFGFTSKQILNAYDVFGFHVDIIKTFLSQIYLNEECEDFNNWKYDDNALEIILYYNKDKLNLGPDESYIRISN